MYYTILLSPTISDYAMLCYAMLCYAMQYYTIRLYIMLCYISTQGGGESHDGLWVLVSTTPPFFPNHTFAHALPQPSCPPLDCHN